ncbi:RNA-binding S4 domain-containing protein [uncultured Tyzzerella sp.]|uniref:RNA-binding S4 domain-containing protein n=1 Tax=uncultured Tyzzerella sp. TaxID=2321398 RepID=UPI0029421A5F|nr:RNA-binding S4 domain-containing protein [uncultured Tyzzerella sp.]
MEEIKFNTEFIKLQQFIKLARVVGQGSDAKMLILDGIVKVNGTTCLERGKKIRNGDIIEIQDFGTFKAIGE